MKVHLSVACSIDGYIDDASHKRLVLSSAEDFADVHRERARCDAILVGAGTVRADNPSLSVRDYALVEERVRNGASPQPTKVTLTSSGNLDPQARFFQGDSEKIVLCPRPTADQLRHRFARLATIIGVQTPVTARGVVEALREVGIRSLLVEGGVHVLSMFISEGAFDDFRLAIAPFFVGDTGAPRLQLLQTIVSDKRDRLTVKNVRLLGDMTVINYAQKPLTRNIRASAVKTNRVKALDFTGILFPAGILELSLVDRSGPKPIRLFESGSILVYLAEKFGAFLPNERADRAECLSWLFWQMGSAPYLGGGFGHFYAYAPTKIEYAINRFAMEVKRQLDVLDRRLAESEYIAGDCYTIADMAIFPWYGGLAKGWSYNAGEFLSVQDYKNVQRWADTLLERPGVQRGRMVNRTFGEPSSQLHERHDTSDFLTRTADKLASA
jgi:riboflavin-specific deaminase-like protein